MYFWSNKCCLGEHKRLFHIFFYFYYSTFLTGNVARADTTCFIFIKYLSYDNILDWWTPDAPNKRKTLIVPVLTQCASKTQTHTNRSLWPTFSFFDISLLSADEVVYFWSVLTEWIKQDAIKVSHLSIQCFLWLIFYFGHKDWYPEFIPFKAAQKHVMSAILRDKTDEFKQGLINKMQATSIK